MLFDLLGLTGVDEERGGVAVAAVSDETGRLGESIVEVRGSVHAEDGGQLLVRPGVGGLDGLGLADENLGPGGNLDACCLRDLGGGLADHLGVDATIHDDGVADLVGLLVVEEVGAALLELGLDCVIHAVEDDHVLLGSTDHAVVEGLGVHDGVDGLDDVCGVVDDGGVVARANAQGRGTGAVCGVDHAGAARREDDVGLLHEGVGELDGGCVDPVDDALGAARGLGGVANDACGLRGALLGARVRGDNDGIPRLEANQRLEDGRRRGVGGGDDGSHNAEGLGDLLHAKGAVVLDDAAGLGVLVLVVDKLSGVMVLDDLVLHHAVAGLLIGHLGERNAGLVRGNGSGIENLVHLLLRELRKLRLGFAHRLQMRLQRLHAIDDRSILCHVTSISPVGRPYGQPNLTADRTRERGSAGEARCPLGMAARMGCRRRQETTLVPFDGIIIPLTVDCAYRRTLRLSACF